MRAPAATTALRDLFQIIGIGAGAVFGGEFYVIDVGAGEFDGGNGGIENLLARLFQLVLQVDVAGGEESVDAGAFGFFEGAGGAFDVEFHGAGERGYLHPGEFAADRVDGLEIAFGGDGEPGFEDIDAEFDQFGGHSQLLGYVHAAAGRLFAVPESGVEDPDSVLHSWKVLRNHYGWAGVDKANLFVLMYGLADIYGKSQFVIRIN